MNFKSRQALCALRCRPVVPLAGNGGCVADQLQCDEQLAGEAGLGALVKRREMGDEAASIYHGLQFRIEKRSFDGLSFVC